jgi:hypothetical protein
VATTATQPVTPVTPVTPPATPPTPPTPPGPEPTPPAPTNDVAGEEDEHVAPAGGALDEVGVAGALPFTGWTLTGAILLAIALLLGGVLMRRLSRPQGNL